MRTVPSIVVRASLSAVCGAAAWGTSTALAQEVVSPSSPVGALPDDQTEPSVAVDPGDPLHILVGAIDVAASGCRYYVTFDGGESWDTGLIDTGSLSRCTDPSVDFSSAGDAYFGGLFYDGNFLDTRLGVARSSDGGATFDPPLLIDDQYNQATGPFDPPGPIYSVDKPYLAVDRSGGPTDGTIHLVWNTLPLDRAAGGCGDLDNDGTLETCPRIIRHAASTDGGATFGGHGNMSLTFGTMTNNFGAHPAVGPDGRLYVAWRRFHYRDTNDQWVPSDAIVVRAPPATNVTVVELGEQAGTANVEGTYRTTRYPIVGVSPRATATRDVYVLFADDPPEFEDVVPDGTVNPSVTDANARGRLIGHYQEADGGTVGFLLHQGQMRRIAMGNAGPVHPRAINDHNRIVGSYYGGDNVERGFTLDGNGFSTGAGQLPFEEYMAPASATTRLTGINNAGVVVGTSSTATTTFRGFVVDEAGYRAFGVPGADRTMPGDLNDDGVIGGIYTEASGARHGFLTSDGATFDTFDPPDGEIESVAAVTDEGHAVGSYRDGGGALRGFRWDGATWATIDVPGATATMPLGVSTAGEIVGGYVAGGVTAGFRTSGTPGQDIWMVSADSDSLQTGIAEPWSERVRVNDRVAGDQFDPWMCVGPDGVVHTAWLDRRDDPGNASYSPYYARSVDGGTTFSPNRRLTRASSDPRDAEGISRPDGAGFIGDYIGLGCGGPGVAVATWPDLRPEADAQDIYWSRAACALTDHGDGTVSDGCAGTMWLRDTNHAATTGTDGDGPMTWEEAVSWADGLVLASFDDWRLPRAVFPDHQCRAGATPLIAIECVGSELGQLYHHRGITEAAPGPFQNLGSRADYFWSGTPYNPNRAWVSNLRHGEMGSGNTASHIELRAWAARDVRPGDTSPGDDQKAAPHPDVTVTFETVTAAGTTSVTADETGPGSAETRFLGTYYDITTTVGHSGDVTVCVGYDEDDLPAGTEEGDLVVEHYDGATWVQLQSTVDEANNVVCAVTPSLSWFALAMRPPRWKWGLGFSILGILGIAVFLWWRSRRP